MAIITDGFSGNLSAWTQYVHDGDVVPYIQEDRWSINSDSKRLQGERVGGVNEGAIILHNSALSSPDHRASVVIRRGGVDISSTGLIVRATAGLATFYMGRMTRLGSDSDGDDYRLEIRRETVSGGCLLSLGRPSAYPMLTSPVAL
jgi:hypothetical protein